MAKITEERRGTYVQTALRIIYENSGQMAARDVIKETGNKKARGPGVRHE